MNKKFLFTALALCSAAFAHAGVVGNIDASAFNAPTIEHFNGDLTTPTSYDFGNGMGYVGNHDLINTTDWYSLNDSGTAMGGIDGDGYFATANASNTFSFTFAGGITRFGFHGAAIYGAGVGGEDGMIRLQFFDTNNVALDSAVVDTSAGFDWDNFFGFEAQTGTIGRVEFQNVGFMVLDDVTFQNAGAAAAVPEPASLALFGLGLVGFGAARRKAARK